MVNTHSREQAGETRSRFHSDKRLLGEPTKKLYYVRPFVRRYEKTMPFASPCPFLFHSNSIHQKKTASGRPFLGWPKNGATGGRTGDGRSGGRVGVVDGGKGGEYFWVPHSAVLSFPQRARPYGGGQISTFRVKTAPFYKGDVARPKRQKPKLPHIRRLRPSSSLSASLFNSFSGASQIISHPRLRGKYHQSSRTRLGGSAIVDKVQARIRTSIDIAERRTSTGDFSSSSSAGDLFARLADGRTRRQVYDRGGIR